MQDNDTVTIAFLNSNVKTEKGDWTTLSIDLSKSCAKR